MDEDPEETQATIDLVVAPEATGQRLDAYLASVVPDMSRSRLKVLIEAGRVSIGGATIVEAKKAVNSGDRIHLSLPEAEPAELFCPAPFPQVGR